MGNNIIHKCLECNHNQLYYEIENYNTNGYKNCYKNPPGYYLDNEASLYKKCYVSCKSCRIQGNNIAHNCLECSDDYYEIENDNANGNKNCYQNPTGYYLDTVARLYKKCYSSCQACDIPGDNIMHNCLECSTDYPLKFPVYNDDSNELNYFNCYFCNYYYYFDENNNFLCTSEYTCPNNFPILEGNECIEDIKFPNMLKILMECIGNDKTKEKEEYCYDSVFEQIEDIFTSKKYYSSKLDEQDEILEIDKAKAILTTTENQKKNINSDNIIIDLGDCENSLRQTYNLTNDEKIYIKILEIIQEEMLIPKVEYYAHAKLNKKNLTKLSLGDCKDKKITLLIPVNNVDNIDKLNNKSGYDNDFCYTATSDSGTDITLKDRQKEYPSKAVCQDGCEFSDYDYNTKKAKCSCDAKESASSFKDMKIDKKKLLDNFKNMKNIANLSLLKYVKVLFSKRGLSKNIGFYLFSAIIIFHAIILIIFYKKKITILKNNINELIFAKKYFKLKKGKEKKKNELEKKVKDKKEKIDKKENKDKKDKKEKKEKKAKKRKYGRNIRNKKEKKIKEIRIRFNGENDNTNINNKKNDDINDINNEIVEENKKIQLNNISKKRKRKRNKVIKKERSSDFNNKNDHIIKVNLNNNNIISDCKKKKKFQKSSKKEKIKNLELIMKYTDDEMNDLSYDLALKNDKRNYW